MSGFTEPTLSATPRDPVLLTTLLVTTPAVVLRRLRASNSEVSRAAAVDAGPVAPADGGPVAVRRWLSTVGDVADDLLRRHELDAGTPAPWAGVVRQVRDRGEPLFREDLAVRGGDLLELGIRGPAVGATLEMLLQRVLEDPSLNRRDTLLTLATPQP